MSRSVAAALVVVVAACGGDPAGPNHGPPPAPTETKPATAGIAAGDGQSAAPSTDVPVAPAVVVRDSAGEALPGVLVTFSIVSGGGSVASDTARTNASGVATVAGWRLGPMPSENRLQATVESLPPVRFSATGRYLVATTPVSGVVTLPAGLSLGLTTLRVETGIANVSVAANGAFTASTLPGGVQLAVVHADNGEPVMFGWFDGVHRAVNARTTAEVLTYFDLGGYTLPEAERRDSVRQFLATADLTALVAAINSALTTSPEHMTLDTPTLRQARVNVLQAFRAAATMPRGIIIDPSGVEQSGIVVDQVGLNAITITNHRRRRVSAFVDRVSYVPEGLVASLPSAMAGQPIPLAAVVSATSVIGTGIDILFGQMAWEPVVSDPQPVPLTPADAVATRYRVTVVGPGVRNSGVTLTSLQQAEQRRAAFETLILEALLPLLDQALQADNALQSRGTGAEVSSVVSVFIDLMPSGVLESAVSGDMQGALVGAWKVLQDSGPGQELLLNTFMTMIADQGVPREVILEKAKKWTKVLAIVEAIATMGDLYVVTEHSASAQDAVTWEVNVAEAQVRLNPERALISNLDIQLFHATVLEATDGGPAPVFRYRWSTTGNFGKICAEFAGCATSIPASSRDVVSYAPDVLKEGTDQITVVVYFVEDGKEHAIGEATSEITTYAPKVEIAPEQSSIDYDEQVSLTATVDPRLLNGGTVRYHWSTAGALGTFLLGETSVETAGNSIIYIANRRIEGTETVTVSVTSTKDGATRNLGSATASIRVEHQRPTIVMGTWTTTPPAPLDAGRSCVTAYLSFPLVADARSYAVRAYGFNDTAFWGNQITFGVTPPTASYQGCSLAGWGRSGTVGNEYRFFLTGFGGPNASTAAAVASFTSRFAGMVVEATVNY